MFEQIIMNLDLNQAKSFLKSQNINLSDEEIKYMLPILKQHVYDLKDPRKRQSIINSLPPSYQAKVNQLLARYSNYL